MTKTLVTPKVNPDLDGTSCAIAYSNLLRQLGRCAEGWITGSPQSEVRYFIEKHNIKIPTRSDEASDDWDDFVLVDASSIKGMPKAVISERVVESIDHRAGEAQKEFPNATIQNELIGAAATMIVEKFIDAEKRMPLDCAKLLYGGIYHNTLNFIATNAVQRDRDAAKYLETNFGLGEEIIKEMFDYSTREVESDVKTALENDAKEFGEGWKIGAYQLIVWGDKVFAQKSSVAEYINELQLKTGTEWSFVNIVYLESKKSHIFVVGDV